MQEERSLWLAVAAAKGDQEARFALADHWERRGDPRGRYLRLCVPKPGESDLERIHRVTLARAWWAEHRAEILGDLAGLGREPRWEWGLPIPPSELYDGYDSATSFEELQLWLRSPTLLFLTQLRFGHNRSFSEEEVRAVISCPYWDRVRVLVLDDVALSVESITELLTSNIPFEEVSWNGGCSVDGMSGTEMYWPTLGEAALAALCASAGKIRSLSLQAQELGDAAVDQLLALPEGMPLRISWGNHFSEEGIRRLGERFAIG